MIPVGNNYQTIQAAIDAASGILIEPGPAVNPVDSVLIPANYSGTDAFSNPNGVAVMDLRPTRLGGTGLNGSGLTYSVVAYGAKCDGVTDDSVAVAAAINAAAVKGGVVVWPSGICIINGQVVIPSNVFLQGQGRSNTILRASPSLSPNANFIETINYATCFNNTSNEALAPSEFGISDLTIDGNFSGRGSGTGNALSIHGSLYQIDSVYVLASPGTVVHAEGLGNGYTHLCEWRDVKVLAAGNVGNAFEFIGPNDSQFRNIIVAGASGIGMIFEASGGMEANYCYLDDFHAFANGSWGLEINNCSVYGGKIQTESQTANGGLYITNAGFMLGGQILTWGNTGIGIKVDSAGGSLGTTNINSITSHNNSSYGCEFDVPLIVGTINSFNNSSHGIYVSAASGGVQIGEAVCSGNGGNGVEWDGTNGSISNGIFSNNTGTGITFGGGSSNNIRMSFTAQSNGGAQAAFGTNTFVNSILMGSLFTAAGTEYTGTPPTSQTQTRMFIGYAGTSEGTLIS